MKSTTIHVDEEVYKHILSFKEVGDTINKVLRRLLLVKGDYQSRRIGGDRVFQGSAEPHRFDDGALGFHIVDKAHNVETILRLSPIDEE